MRSFSPLLALVALASLAPLGCSRRPPRPDPAEEEPVNPLCLDANERWREVDDFEREGRFSRSLRVFEEIHRRCPTNEAVAAEFRARLTALLDAGDEAPSDALRRARELRAAGQPRQAQLALDRALRRAERLAGSPARAYAFPDVGHLSWSADGASLAFDCSGVCVARLADRITQIVVSDKAAFYRPTLSPDGKLVAALSSLYDSDEPASVSVWDVASRKLLHRHSTASGSAPLAFNADGSLLLSTIRTGDDAEAILLWDTRTQKPRATLSLPRPSSDDESAPQPGHAFFSPDGKHLAMIWGLDRLTLWDASTGAHFLGIKDTNPTQHHSNFSPQFSPDSGVIAWMSDRSIERFHLASKRLLPSLPGSPACDPMVFSFHPTAPLLAVGTEGTGACVWSLDGAPSSRQVVRAGKRCEFSGCGSDAVALSADGKLLALHRDAGTSPTSVFDARTGAEVSGFDWELRASFSASSNAWAWIDAPGDLRVVEAKTGRSLLRSSSRDYYSPPVLGPDGHRVAVRTVYNGLVVLDVATSEPILSINRSIWSDAAFHHADASSLDLFWADGLVRLPLDGSPPSSMLFPDGTRYRGLPGPWPLARNRDGDVYALHALVGDTWAPIALPPSFKRSRILHAAAVPDRPQVALLELPPGDPDGVSLHLLDIALGEFFGEPIKLAKGLARLEPSRDGRYLAAYGDELVQVVDLRQRKVVTERSLGKTGGYVFVAMLGADHLAIGAKDAPLQIVQLPGGEALESAPVGETQRAVASPSGLFLALYDDSLRLIDTRSGQPRELPPGAGQPLGFSRDDRLLFTSSGRRSGNEVIAWDIDSATPHLSLSHRGGAVAAVAPSGSFELLGDRAIGRSLLSCRVGDVVYPIELCEDALDDPGLAARVLAEKPR